MLSWTDVRDAGDSADWAYNVVIHEFAHVLDMADGERPMAHHRCPVPSGASIG